MDSISAVCQRCKQPSALTAREHALCQTCFTNFLSGKVTKRVGSYVRDEKWSKEKRLYLVPLSFGPSSLALIHIMNGYRQFQMKKSGKCRFQLHFVHVQVSGKTQTQDYINQLRHLYPDFTFSFIPISSIFGEDQEQPNNDSKLARLLATLPSVTAEDDVLHILLSRSLVQFAQKNRIQHILWGHTTTKLAERVLSETAKGRGYSLPWQVSDGETPFGVDFYYPLRDVFRKEVIQYLAWAEPDLTKLIFVDPATAPVNLKNISIDSIMNRYFESAEQQYPSIVSNVVRTSTKLSLGHVSLVRCKLCNFPITDTQKGDDPIIDFNVCCGCVRNVTNDTLKLLL